MIEIVILIGVILGISARAKKRGVRSAWPIIAAVLAWMAFVVFTPWPYSLFLSWGAVGVVALIVELTHGAKRLGDVWQCPECRLYNDEATFICGCGYRHPEAPASVRAA
ncbi:MAG: hypothetical protein AAGD38_08110 [Acidobacteriota bacterium]